ncbi:Structural maintenance of chromosomes protein 5 [Leucoagaricus sp. SymC.cos]|nr:Structural maintenance of chromosomes protein 5 [Leucoagaricus sp. SymC.cos]
MARRPVVASDDEGTVAGAAPVKREKAAVKEEGRKTRAKAQEQQQEEQDVEGEEDVEGEGEDAEGEEDDADEEHAGTPKGAKRRRLNVDGNSVPSRTVSQEADEEEDEEGDFSQTPIRKSEFKTLPRDTDGYIPGSIVRVQLKNFLTYEFVEFKPSPYLNMVIGPNGSGKSSIACALCIGLNFHPNVLGRADAVKSFIKAGKEEGYTEIELKGPPGKPNLIIRRNVVAGKNTTSFTLNGNSVSGQEIKARMAELNVQVGNLCTFLPQDKVSSFAAMTPQELLRETQRCAGDNRLTNWHTELIKSGNDLRELKVRQETDEAAKTQAQQRVDMMEHTVRLFNERRELEHQRRRLNVDGNSVPSRTVSQEADEEEDEEGDFSQTPIRKSEFKTLPRDTDGYIPGSIVRVQLKNFLTYEFVEFKPSPYLNMVIGPNGSGKSSIACALCIGLNFHPNVLGRADAVKSFIKAGKEEGYTEIELKGPPGKPNLIIRRNVVAGKNTTSFTLNGNSVSGQEIKARMAELNVQVGNLCTFLPQDKVSSFAAMTPQELLRETQRCAGDNRLTNWHTELIKSGNDLRELKVRQETDEAAKTQAQQRVDMMEHTVRLFNERRELEHQQAILSVVIDTERYRLRLVEYNRLKVKQRTMNAKVQKLRQKNQPVRQRLEALQEASKELHYQFKAGNEAQNKRLKKFGEVFDKLEALEEQVDYAYQDLEALKKNEEERQKDMKKLQTDIESTEQELAKPPPETEKPAAIKADEDQAQNDGFILEGQHNDLEREFRVHLDKRQRAKNSLEEAERRVNSFTDADAIKLQNMLRWHQDTHDAILWLRQHRHLFKMEVFEPPYMCMTVPDQRFQDGVEAMINSAQFRTFVAQCKEDIDTLNKHINDTTEALGRRARVVTWYRAYNEQQLTPPPMSREEMAHLGFDGYVLDYVDCPEGLKWFLKRECNFHRNAIALDARRIDIGAAMEAVGRPETGGGASFVCGNTMNIVQRSRYGSRALNNMTRDIPKARNLTVQTAWRANILLRPSPVDPEIRRQAEETVRSCQEQLAMCDEERKGLDARQAALREKGAEVEERIRQIKKRKDVIKDIEKKRVSLEGRLRRLKGQLKELKNQPNEEQQKKKLRKTLVQKNYERADKIKELTALMKPLIPAQQEVTQIKLNLLQNQANCNTLEELTAQRDTKFQLAYAEYQKLNEAYKRKKDESKVLLEQWKRAHAERPEEIIQETDRIIGVRNKYFNALIAWEDALEAVGGDEEELRNQNIHKPVPPENAQEGDLRGLDELEIACRTVQEQLEYNNNRDESVVRSYEEKKRQVEQLTDAMETRQKKIDDTEAKIKRTRDRWEPSLRGLIHTIRIKFSDAFDRIGCAGDVELMPDPDYAQWRIDIKVKFRDNEKLQLLTGQRQSGGERSLTTILYLMSLTTLAHTPFSLVDEINQGMDQRAERMVHNSMVDVTCKEESSQYFLITPKLLPDLNYHKRMRVLCVYNGDWVAEEANGDMKALLRSYKTARTSA